MRYMLLALVIAAGMLTPAPARAQFTLPTFPAQISLHTTPEHPAPGETVTLTLESFSIDLGDSDIEWYVNDEPFRAAPALRTIELAVGPSGSPSEVTAIINAPDGAQYVERITLRPTTVDLIWEAGTYTPPFYRGRPLPSQGSTLYAEARPTFVRPDGSTIAPETLIYTWERDGRVLTAQSGRDRAHITLSMPALANASTLSVSVHDRTHTFTGSAQVRIPATNMQVTLHNDDPVLGIMYHQALGVGGGFSETEAVVAAVPYFASIASPYDEAITYAWELNGEPLESDPQEPFKLILQLLTGARGSATVSLAAAHDDALLQQVSRSWQVSLGADVGAPQESDPFRRPVN